MDDYHVLLGFFVAKSPPTAEMTVVLVPVAWVRMVELEVTVGTETSESEVDEATPTGGGGGGGAEPSAEPWSHLLLRFFSLPSPSEAEERKTKERLDEG